MVLGGKETVETLKRLLSMHRNSIACDGGSQGWREGGGGEVGGMIPKLEAILPLFYHCTHFG